MSDPQHTDTTGSTEKQRAIVFDEGEPLAAIESLPPTVFPVTLRLKLGKTTTGDRTHDKLSTPDYPVDVRLPHGPYIPESTVYFDNPAERPPRNTTPWRPAEFIDRLSALLDALEDEESVDPDRLYLEGICVVELSPRHTTTDRSTGQSVATPDLYTDEGDMTLGYFTRDGGLSATKVREDLNTAMPGESRSPLQLVQITEVTAKPSRSSRQTQGSAGRHKYYTEIEASRAGKNGATPAVWKLDRVSNPGESHRPLTPVLSDIDRFFPALADAEVFEPLSFRGEVETRERFYAEEVLQG